MKRHWIAFLISFYLTGFVKADQNLSIDSMIRLVEEGKLSDTTIAFLQYEIGYNLRVTDQVRAHQYVDRAIQTAISYKNDRLLHQAYRIKGIVFANQRNFKQSFEYLYKAITYGQKTNDYELLASGYMSLGDILRTSRSYVLAEKYINKALLYHQLAGSVIYLGYAKRMLANISYSRGRYQRALFYYREALKHYRNHNMLQYIYGTFNDIGLCYKNLGRYDLALAHYDSSLYYATKYDPAFCGIIYGNKGEVYLLEKDYKSALVYLNMDLDYNRNNLFELSSLVNTYSQIATVHELTNKPSLAILYLDSAIAVCNSPVKVNNQYKLKVLRQKAYLLDQVGRDAEAFHELNNMVKLWDEMQTQNDDVKTLESQISLELSGKEKEVSVLETKLNSEQLITRLFIIFIVILIAGILIILIYYNQSKDRLRNLKSQYALIEKQQEELDRKSKQIEINNHHLKTANEKLSELNEEKNEFIRLVVHDLKNPLSRVQGLTELIEMEPETRVKDQNEKLEYIRLSVEEMNALIERFLDVNRMESGQQRVHLEICNIPRLVQEEVEHMQVQASEKLINIHFDSSRTEALIETDPQILKHILRNILSNAVKFSPFNKSVFVTIQEQKDQLIIRVKDEGPGLSEYDKQNMFKKFTRLSARPTGNESTTGLGLYLVKILAEKAGIQISFESTLGMGTEFSISVPNKSYLQT